eukprot:CAMPEP_0172670958 /NCGR_PEP_ID=MMETSP1074-20121228/10614_1 /TAXON_ID=2916 /ORGANISM="Ceratium fusus, Strain PA161109" /LENGTH=103 /DNA_ID=CAMNT_0013487935 /DNA_START=427 /DNA_END=736 /DNA_ORIENTATION=+
MTYVWGRRNSAARMQVLMITVRAPYVPWVLAGISLLMGSNVQDHLMGIAVGHIYYFFVDVYPLLPTSKGIQLFRTPQVLKFFAARESDHVAAASLAVAVAAAA